MAVALRRRHAYDVPFLHGKRDNVGRDCIVMGTALSAPAVMLGAQAVATFVLARRPSSAAVRVVGVLGLTMVPGYLCERLVRRRLRPSSWDALESPVMVLGISLAAAMAWLAHRSGAP